MINRLIDDALKARDAAESVYRNLSADVPLDIEKAAYLKWQAAKALISGLLQEERRVSAARPVSEVPQTTY